MPLGPNAGYKLFTTGDILTAAQVQNNLQNQSIMFFASAAARDASAPLTAALTEGMFCYLADTNTTQFYDGATWQSFGTGDVTGLTAGSGITIASPGGPVPTISIDTATTVSLTASQTLTNKTFTSPKETVDRSATATTGTVNIDVVTSSVKIHTANATANFTINVRGNGATTLDSLMAVGEQLTVVFECLNGATPYYATAYQVDGTAVTPKWLGGSAPAAGNANSSDVYTITVVKIGAGSFTCLASLNKFA